MFFGKFASLLHSKNIHSIDLHQPQGTISVPSINWIEDMKTKIKSTSYCADFAEPGDSKKETNLANANIN
jgi:hypothetical protein